VVIDSPAPSYGHAISSRPQGCTGYRGERTVAALADERVAVAVKWLTDGSPDLHFELDWMAAAGDKVTVWLYGSGTNTGDWTFPPSAGPSACQPLPPTNLTGPGVPPALRRTASLTDESLTFGSSGIGSRYSTNWESSEPAARRETSNGAPTVSTVPRADSGA
jgi:hypothetical protein